ncbi:MAG: cysteine synthase family protein [bacterium]|nr:cysteine synthase family protein [bacterium]
MTATISSNNVSLGTDSARKRYSDIRDLLPDVDNPTPLVRLNRVTNHPAVTSYLKLEWLNPFGSVKDRAAAYLLAGMLERGSLEGRDIVEASSGNTAIALAALAGLSGKHLTVTIPDGVPDEKKVMLRMLGAEVWETPDDLCPIDHPKDGAIALARSLAASEGGNRYAMANQYENEDNVRAHYETTGPEIWRQTEGRVRYFVAGLGTTGTITGAGRYLKEQDPSIQVIAIEPQRGHRLPGLKSFQEAKEPGILDWDIIDEVVRVDDEPAYDTTKRLHREEGLIVGPSTGAVVHAISQLPESAAGIAIGISPDSGSKYTSYFGEILGEDGIPKI